MVFDGSDFSCALIESSSSIAAVIHDYTFVGSWTYIDSFVSVAIHVFGLAQFIYEYSGLENQVLLVRQ